MDSVLGEIVDTIWQTVLGVGIERAPARVETDPRTLTGCIRFTGAWPGSLTASCSEILAQRIANAMFKPETDASEDEIRDAFGEVVNMLGGNLKAVLPGACQLSLPAVFRNSEFRPCLDSGDIVTMASFVTEGECFVVRLFRAPASSDESSIRASTNSLVR